MGKDLAKSGPRTQVFQPLIQAFRMAPQCLPVSAVGPPQVQGSEAKGTLGLDVLPQLRRHPYP